MADFQITIAGFGGQGVLFSGKAIAYTGLIEWPELSWLPSYGPEMRGGTANCNVILSEKPVGSPIVTSPNVLIVMNEPSLDRYEDTVESGGKIFIDSSLIKRKVKRTDVEIYYIPATQMANEMELTGLANMILLGAMVNATKCVTEANFEKALQSIIPPRKAAMFEANLKAFKAGKEYKG